MAGVMGRGRLVYALSLGLFVAGEAVILLALDSGSAWPICAGWAVAAMVVFFVARAVHAPAVRLALSALLVVACVLLIFAGGLFFAPAAFVLLVGAAYDYLARRPSQQPGV
jgi:hypothetical protein